MFAELHCTTAFTFLTGASQPEELVERAAEMGYQALAITDECSLAGVVRAHQAARQHPLQLIVGSTVSITLAGGQPPLRLVLLAPDKNAYSELSTLITRGRRRASKGDYQLYWRDLERIIRSCLLLWLPTFSREPDQAQAALLRGCFADRLWLTCELLQTDHDGRRYHYLYQLAEEQELRLVAANDVHMHTAGRQPLQDVLTALRHNTCVQQLGHRRLPNAERHLRPIHRLRTLYPHPLLAETLTIAERCTFSLDELRYQYPRESVPEHLSPARHLRQLVEDGAARRWPAGMSEGIREQMERELALIAEKEYEHYFLTVHDIVAFARGEGILCQGRGSAANSVVCYCLFITEVSPDKTNLLFERFISRERDEPPDIDVDFEHERREEVIQYLYRKYGRDHAALAATVICYRPRSAVRDVGKALGLDADRIDALAKNLAWVDAPGALEQRFREVGLNDSRLARLYRHLVTELVGLPRHLSQHVGGFVISRDPVHSLVPIENAAMDERTLIQWDKDDLEALGLMKVDVLALGMLSAIRKMFALTANYREQPLTLPDVPADDEATYTMLSRGDSLGVFQVESRAQMNMLPRLRPCCFYDLVIEVAIVRPGPIQGDMVHPYLRRRDGEEAVDYPDERIRNVLKRTLGIPIFQEQVIQLVMVAAGFSGGRADALRRAMARWGKSGELQHFREEVIDGMLAHGYDQAYAEQLFEQMKGFGGYGFPESHSASFALLVYISAWLKRHHTAAFYCGLLNSLPMGFYTPSQIIQDAQKHGIEVRGVDVDASLWDHSLEDSYRRELGVQPALRMGLRQIKGFNEDAAERLIRAREQAALAGVSDLCERARLSADEREALAAANAMQRLTGHRRQAQWELQAVEATATLLQGRAGTGVFRDGVVLDAPNEVENLLADYRSLGLTLGRHPLALIRHREPFRECRTARGLRGVRHGGFARVAGLVTNRQRPGSASGILFMTLEDETGNINVVVHPDRVEPLRPVLLGGQLLEIRGTLERSPEGITHLVLGRARDHSDALARLQLRARNFR
jgi:error-prone DNA polymerase